ncbi:AMP-binding protein [Sandaracinus amylolyticus]|uniref:AMP-binding protein n=1 Tax=Sandaracinus amylolyticus TaxID=927083 RepID=UPI001F236C7E|nr:AMP-binding protein [Sandaracinus amylolyticus]UJR81052.1 Long-chain-fatty-acid--CoA ligase [Sandaracinus amylolyticus]
MMIPPEGYDSLGELLHDALVQWKSETALIEVDRRAEKKRLTYLDVRREVAPVARWLADRGVGPGDRVAIVMSNQARWPIAAIALFARGAVMVPLDYKLSGDEQVALLRHAGARALITEHPLLRRMKDLPAIDVLVSEAPESERSAQRWEDLDPDVIAPPVERRMRSDAASIVYSSGTGGRAKGCVLTHDAYLEQLGALMRLFPMRPGHKTFSVLPTNHAIDFMVGFLGPFACGSTVVHQRTLRPEFLVSTMREHRITHMALVPLLLAAFERAIDEKIDERPAWQRAALGLVSRANAELTRAKPDVALSRTLLGGVHHQLGGALELLFCGGAFVDRRRAERFYELGIPVVIGYGLTECCTVATVNDLRPFRADSVGRAVHGVEVRVHAPGADGVGEIWIRGRTVMREYWNDAELTARTITEDGWLRTGDLGWLDASAHLHLVGRSKNMIVTAGGKNVYPEDVESAFEGVACEELAVFASGYVWPRHAALTEEQLVIVVRTKSAAAMRDAEREIAARNRRLPEHKRVHAVLAWSDSFPRTASMKVKREALAEQLRAGARPEQLVALERASGAMLGGLS